MNTLCLCVMKTSYCTIEGISHGTSAVSWPSRVIQMSKSLCLKPNPFLDEPNKTNLAPVYKKYTLTNKHLYSPPITYKTYKIEKEKLRNIQHTNLALEWSVSIYIYIYIFIFYFFIRASKWLIAFKIKVCLHTICVCTEYIYYVYTVPSIILEQ